jgi:hypothetical protein
LKALSCQVPKQAPHQQPILKDQKDAFSELEIEIKNKEWAASTMAAAIVFFFLCSSLWRIIHLGKYRTWAWFNGMCRLPRQACGRRGRYQLHRKKAISDPVHNHTHFFPNKKKEILLTLAKRYDTSTGGAEQARIDTLKLSIEHRVMRRLFVERRRRHTTPLMFSALCGCLR